MALHPHLIVPIGPDPVRFTSPSTGCSQALTLPARYFARRARAEPNCKTIEFVGEQRKRGPRSRGRSGWMMGSASILRS